MSKICEVVFVKEGKQVTVAEGTTLLQAARMAGVGLEAPCNGQGTCGKCRVKAVGMMNSPEQVEMQQLDGVMVADVRFACQAKVYGPVQVETLSDRRDSFVTLEAGQSNNWPFKPSIRKIKVDTLTNPSALIASLVPVFPSNFPAMLQGLATEYGKGMTCIEAVVKNDQLLDLQYQSDRPYFGLSVDIGTTSVVVELFNLENGEKIGVASCLNPQAEFGGDVMTRIAFASQHTEGTEILQRKIADGINRLIEELVTQQNLNTKDIYEIVIAGNTTMLHLLMGVNPRSLAAAPYRPIFTQQMIVDPTTVGLDIAPHGIVTILPSVAAFVGADIVAGLLAVGLHNYSQTALFIDIGTNGEIVICKEGVLVGTSAAAGPALEGMNIACGCRAEDGAIENFAITNDGIISMKTIGNRTPRGICGSGLIDLVASLVKVGVIEKNGRFSKKAALPQPLADKLATIDGQLSFVISEEGPVFLSQKDIRQVQLAKGAIVAAIELLLKELHISHDAINEVLIAGAFGFHLNPASLIGIGLLPLAFRDKIRFVGNTANEGAKAVLLNYDASVEVLKIGQNITIKELSLQPEFQEYFVQSLAFPALAVLK